MEAAPEVAATTWYCCFGSGSCAIFRSSEHAGTSEHLQAAPACSAHRLDLGRGPALEGVFTIYVLALPEMRAALSLHGRLAWKAK